MCVIGGMIRAYHIHAIMRALCLKLTPPLARYLLYHTAMLDWFTPIFGELKKSGTKNFLKKTDLTIPWRLIKSMVL
jgi:hypothetical protein